jgi:C_GCAxxG_C_C family probable redox protein
MEETKIKEIVNVQYKNGFHCAEAIVNTINEIFPADPEFSCNVTSGFCGGIGKCKEDICGALAGGIIALGSMYGRVKGGDNINKLIFLSGELRRSFIEEFKSTVCKNVIEYKDNSKEFGSCQDVTAKTTKILCDLIIDNP